MTDRYWRNARLNRRSLIAAGGTAALVAACGKNSKPAGTSGSSGGTTAANQPKKGGSFRYVNNSSGTMDPAQATPTPLWYDMYEWLAVYDTTNNKIVPTLAKSWEQTDPSTIVLHVDPNATWQNKAPVNGRKLTSQDVQYTIKYFNTPKPTYSDKSYFSAIDLNRIETPDNVTVTLHLTQPSVPQLPTLLTTPELYVIPHEIVERDGDLTKTAIGSGPFMVDTYTPNGSAHLVRNPTYWRPGLPYLDDIQSIYLLDIAAQFNGFQTGNIEMLQRLTLDQSKNLPKTANILIAPSWQWGGFRFNVTRKPFDDLRVRQAISYAIDRDAINQLIYAGHSAPSAAVPGSYGKFALPKDELSKQPGYRTPKDQDLTTAKQLLAAAGASNLEVSILGSNNSIFQSQSPVAVVDQLAKIGVKATPNIQDIAPFQSARQNSNFAIVADAMTGNLDPDATLRQPYYGSSSANWGKYSNPKLDALIDQQAVEPDADKRLQIIYDIQRMILMDVPIANISYDVGVTALQPYVKGVAEWVGTTNYTPWYGLGQSAWLDK